MKADYHRNECNDICYELRVQELRVNALLRRVHTEDAHLIRTIGSRIAKARQELVAICMNITDRENDKEQEAK